MRAATIGSIFSAWLLLVGTAAAQQSDWAVTPTAGQDRYGSAGGAAAQPLQQPASLPATASNRDITPLPSGNGAASGMAPVGPNAPTRAKVTSGVGALPHDHGQVWREYDIRPYTLRVANTNKPEQTIVDWVLRETGYEAWHSDPLGVLSASRDTLRVYHTPQMQAIVADIVDRFVNSHAEPFGFSLRMASIRSPNWRAKALPLLTPIPVQSPGIQGWVMAKENAAMLLADLSRRSDFREHSSSNQIVLNGQHAVVSTMRPRSYIRGLTPTPNAWPGFQPEMGQIEEGITLEFSPLMGHDLSSADAVIKIRLLQIEKMNSVDMDIPSPAGANQRMKIEVPQMTMASMHERFRWPAGQVLLLSMGVVATPAPDTSRNFLSMIPGVDAPPRADGLLFVEAKGMTTPAASSTGGASTAARTPGGYMGRY
ncbi:hypothetical protein Pla175_09020 [Pirellulimonas nuda]|uniref:Bacterial type II and III secretion system protein n=1 Tax=Pirellulimonas nuda TaxID=2528009 RepID=A0A518D7T8_9BACT|nr:hypothetical protein [Pirellulimonas nuda]QDU87540.1 hypothetical protein Pla175_09020 [Pirellulimonas nuda]